MPLDVTLWKRMHRAQRGAGAPALLISERALRTFLALEFRQPIYSFYGPHRPSGPLPFSVFIPDPHWRSVLLGKILSKLFSFTLCDVIPTILLFSVFFLPSFMLCFSRCSFEKYFTLGMLKSYLEYLYFYNIYGELMYQTCVRNFYDNIHIEVNV